MPGIQQYFPSGAQTDNLKEGEPQTGDGIFFFNIEENMVHGLSNYQKETENLPKITLYTICSLLAAQSYNTSQWRSLRIKKHGLFDLYFAFTLSD